MGDLAWVHSGPTRLPSVAGFRRSGDAGPGGGSLHYCPITGCRLPREGKIPLAHGDDCRKDGVRITPTEWRSEVISGAFHSTPYLEPGPGPGGNRSNIRSGGPPSERLRWF